MEEKIMNAEEAFKRVLKTLRDNKIMVKKSEDGIYIRLADSDKENGAFTFEWAKVLSYNEKKRTKIISKEKQKDILFFSPYIHITTTKKNSEYEKFMDEYYRMHALCPKCGAREHSTTLVGYILNMEKKDEYKDKNNCECSICGDRHITHARVEDKNPPPKPLKIEENFNYIKTRYSKKKVNSKFYSTIKIENNKTK